MKKWWTKKQEKSLLPTIQIDAEKKSFDVYEKDGKIVIHTSYSVEGKAGSAYVYFTLTPVYARVLFRQILIAMDDIDDRKRNLGK